LQVSVFGAPLSSGGPSNLQPGGCVENDLCSLRISPAESGRPRSRWVVEGQMKVLSPAFNTLARFSDGRSISREAPASRFLGDTEGLRLLGHGAEKIHFSHLFWLKRFSAGSPRSRSLAAVEGKRSELENLDRSRMFPADWGRFASRWKVEEQRSMWSISRYNPRSSFLGDTGGQQYSVAKGGARRARAGHSAGCLAWEQAVCSCVQLFGG
jgi:hypothetical protein